MGPHLNFVILASGSNLDFAQVGTLSRFLFGKDFKEPITVCVYDEGYKNFRCSDWKDFEFNLIGQHKSTSGLWIYFASDRRSSSSLYVEFGSGQLLLSYSLANQVCPSKWDLMSRLPEIFVGLDTFFCPIMIAAGFELNVIDITKDAGVVIGNMAMDTATEVLVVEREYSVVKVPVRFENSFSSNRLNLFSTPGEWAI